MASLYINDNRYELRCDDLRLRTEYCRYLLIFLGDPSTHPVRLNCESNRRYCSDVVIGSEAH